MKTLLIIPAYNEAKNILNVADAVAKSGYDYIIVNDGSTDNTLTICLEHDLPVINLKENLGIGGAVQTGHKYAAERGYDIDIQFDGDGQHDVSGIPPLIEAVEKGANLVVGSRFLQKTKGFQSSYMRRVGIRWLSACIRLFTGKTITDPTSGFRACNVDAIRLFCKEYPSDYPEPESIVTALKHGLKVNEVSVIMHDRTGGSSSIRTLSSIYYMVKVSLAIAILSLTPSKEGH